VGGSGDLTFDESQRVVVNFRTEKAEPTADHSCRDRQTEKSKYLSMVKMREKNDSKLQTPMRERVPLGDKIRSPSPDEGRVMRVTGPSGPIKI
jgi:hypothetical protein